MYLSVTIKRSSQTSFSGKCAGEGTYVFGLEPSNCGVEGRAEERERGTLQFIEPGGRRHYEVEIGVLTSNAEIDAFQEKITKTQN